MVAKDEVLARTPQRRLGLGVMPWNRLENEDRLVMIASASGQSSQPVPACPTSITSAHQQDGQALPS